MKPWRICRLLFAGALALAAAQTMGDEGLNIYNWSDYIADNTIPDFTKQTGIKVKYDNYDSDESLQAKLWTGRTGYDIVVPTSNFAAKQILAGVYMKLDKSKLPNLSHLDPELMAKIAEADPGNQYLVPWTWGTDGLGYNVTKVKALLGPKADLRSWDTLFKPEIVSKLQSCGISMLDSASDVFPAALFYIGRSPTSIHKEDYEAAYEMLKKIRPYVTQFNSSGYINDLAGGDICMAYGFSGDVFIAGKRAKEAGKPFEVSYFIPRGGAPLWVDTMGVLHDAPHPANALKWINYIETPEVHAAITNKVFYPNANRDSKPFVDPEIRNNVDIYPPPDVMKSLFLLKPLPPEIVRLENRLWQAFKMNR